MTRIALGIEYCGSNFNGWQTQKDGRTVQQTIEKALSVVADQEISVQCAGRTDTGVHAVHQVVHLDCEAERQLHSWVLGGNANLPNDVNICWAQNVSDKFHARFSAIARSYRYLILNRSTRYSLLHKKITWECRPLDHEKMASAGQCLLGEHDFTSFRAVACQAKSPIRTVHAFQLRRHGDYILFDIVANAFLQHMVRNIAGVLMEIGMGKRPVEWAEEVLAIKDRTLAGMTAPADGLYLAEVQYPNDFSIPKPDRAQWPFCF